MAEGVVAAFLGQGVLESLPAEVVEFVVANHVVDVFLRDGRTLHHFQHLLQGTLALLVPFVLPVDDVPQRHHEVHLLSLEFSHGPSRHLQSVPEMPDLGLVVVRAVV